MEKNHRLNLQEFKYNLDSTQKALDIHQSHPLCLDLN